ncbi:MAG TPA: condensation domain-containing protein, partial [Longimicrobium sp.]|nr:condensation domain-containing protein [Longimicrobium sp.]
DPFGGGGRIYRTGDRVRWLADGEIAFLGRLDGQVKVRGHRVEPGEVESVLLEHPGVPRAAVVVREGPSGDRRLVAYVAAGDAAPDPAELRAWLRERLPEPMVPSAVVVLESFPLTPSGKVDRRALPAPDDDAAGARGYVAPRTAAEAAIAGIWAEVLGRERVGAEDDFFELGGHSLLATRVASRVGAALGVRLPLRALFEAPTVAGVAARVEALLGAAPDAGPPPIVPVPRESGLPLSFAQQRLWLLHQMEAGGAYNIPVALRVSGALDAAALAWALTGVVRRHEVLRTTLHADADGRPVQVVGPPAPALLPAVDLSALDDAAREHEARRLARAESTLPFDLERGPLYRCALLRLAPGDTVVLFTLHHVVSDGWSMEILVREVSALYGAYLRGEAPALAPLAVQYADYAAWQRGWLRGEVMERELAYWRGALAGAPAVLALPTDRPRPPVQGFAGRSVSARLAPEVSARLAELGRREAATPNMALLAAFAAVLFRHTGQEKVIVGAPMANRAHPEVEGLIGFFVNLLPVCVDLSGDPPLLELVRRVRAVSLEAYTHQELPFERLVEALQVPRLPGVPPLVQAVFAFEHVPEGGEAGFPGLDVYPLAGVVDDTARFDLRLTVAQEGGALGASLAYDVALFDGATAARLLADFQAMADALAAAPETRVLDVPLAGRPAAAPAREEPRAALAESAEFDFEALGA